MNFSFYDWSNECLQDNTICNEFHFLTSLLLESMRGLGITLNLVDILNGYYEIIMVTSYLHCQHKLWYIDSKAKFYLLSLDIGP